MENARWEAERTLRSNTRAIVYDSSNQLTNCSDFFNAYCLLNNSRPITARGHKNQLNEVIDITTDENNEEVRTPLTDILNGKVNHIHDITEIIKTTTITNEEEEEVVELLSDLLDGKTSINHNHDSSYTSINYNHSYNDLNDKPDLGKYSARIPRKVVKVITDILKLDKTIILLVVR